MPLLGECSALLTAFLWAIASLAFASVSRRVGSVQINFARLVLATVFLALAIPALGIGVRLSAFQVANLAISGFAGLVLGDTFMLKSFAYNGVRLSTVLMTTVPALSAVLAYFFLGETLSAACM